MEREFCGMYPLGARANWSYEHHNLDEPAVDCWNVTDGSSHFPATLIFQGRELDPLFRDLLRISAR